MLRQIRAAMYPPLPRLVEADDILQDALARALISPNSCRAETPEGVRAWVMTIARNRIRDISRRSRKQSRPRRGTALPASMLLPLDDEAAQILIDDPGLTRIDTWEDSENALRVLHTLAPTQRLCVVLRDLLDLPWSTVAFALRRSPRAARELHLRARRELAGRSD
jgi:RNA polymerase sigma factor (sigma-70 family)